MLACVFATDFEMKAVLPEAASGKAMLFCGREILPVVAGVGPVAAGIAGGEVLSGGGLSGLVNLGIGGSFDMGRNPLRTVVLADEEIFAEYGVRTAGGVDGDGLGFPQLRADGEDVFERLALKPEQAAEEAVLRLSDDWAADSVLTVAAASADAAVAQAMRERFSPGVEAMEGFALALACKKAGVPFLELRAVSNPVGERDKGLWDIRGALQALSGAARTLISGDDA